jgi:hypothetical protein
VKKFDFEKPAVEGGFSKPLVNRRIPELPDAIPAGLNQNSFEQTVVSALKQQIC